MTAQVIKLNQLLKNKKDNNVKTLLNKKNLGLGASVLRGYKIAKSNYCTYVPGDNSTFCSSS